MKWVFRECLKHFRRDAQVSMTPVAMRLFLKEVSKMDTRIKKLERRRK
jgi:hypothetical protein